MLFYQSYDQRYPPPLQYGFVNSFSVVLFHGVKQLTSGIAFCKNFIYLTLGLIIFRIPLEHRFFCIEILQNSANEKNGATR